MIFSILHSSARPYQWRKVYDAWMSAAVHPELVEYVLCVDQRWGFPAPSEFRSVHSSLLGTGQGDNLLVVENTQRRCYVDGVNHAAAASHGRVLIVNADDQFPCAAWDEDLLQVLERRAAEVAAAGADPAKWPDSVFAGLPGALQDFVIEVETGTPLEHERRILVLPILSRARYERLGYVFFPEYESMYADNDFCEHARQDAVVIDARRLPVFPHRHPLFDESARKPGVAWQDTDAAYQAQNSPEAYRHGAAIFRWRQRMRFGEVLAEADKIEGWMRPRELAWLSLQASQMKSVAEIGSWKGRSTYVLAAACDGPVYAVDHFRGTAGDTAHESLVRRSGGSTLMEFRKTTARYRNVNVVQDDSFVAAQQVPDCEMVFIDGGHSYDRVLADLRAWVPKASKLICGHDYEHPAVKRAVTEVLGEVDLEPGTDIWFKALPRVASVSAQRTIALCLTGEIFHGEYLDAILTLYGHLVSRGFAVWRSREYTTNVYISREQVRRVMMATDPKSELFLWIDDDNPAPTPAQFDRLLAQLDAHPDYDGIAGWCWIYDNDLQSFKCSAGMWSADNLHWRPFDFYFSLETQVRDVEASGMPCFLMKRSALEKAGDGSFLPILDKKFEHGLMGEDHAFLHRAQDAGAKFLVDPTVRVRHLKYCEAAPELPAIRRPNPRVAVMARVRNEARWISRTIESVKGLVCNADAGYPAIFVLEDGSTDETAELARRAGAALIDSPFAGLGLDEGRDKSFLLDYVKRQVSGLDWVLCIDGDEELEPDGAEKILRVLRTEPAVDCFSLPVLNFWDGVDQIRTDGVYGRMGRQSLFRAVDGVGFRSYYEGLPGHNHTGLHVSNAPRDLKTESLFVFLLHYGYLHKEDRIRKYRWILSIDPENEHEDYYRHTVQGDVPEVAADAQLKHGGPLQVSRLPARMVPRFAGEVPGPITGVDPRTVAEVSA